jgi:hypothetical protein
MSDPRRPQDLWDSQVSARDTDQRPVLGGMARYVGHQFTDEEVWQYYRSYADVHAQEEAELRPLARRIRAFDVPALAGVTFGCRRFSDLAAVLEQVVAEQLPGTACGPFDRVRPGRVKKYGIIHEVVPAPPDEATGEDMVLELFGRLESLSGEPVGRDWYRRRWPEHPPDDDAEIGALAFRLARGTYANTNVPGVGIPFYL